MYSIEVCNLDTLPSLLPLYTKMYKLMGHKDIDVIVQFAADIQSPGFEALRLLHNDNLVGFIAGKNSAVHGEYNVTGVYTEFKHRHKAVELAVEMERRLLAFGYTSWVSQANTSLGASFMIKMQAQPYAFRKEL